MKNFYVIKLLRRGLWGEKEVQGRLISLVGVPSKVIKSRSAVRYDMLNFIEWEFILSWIIFSSSLWSTHFSSVCALCWLLLHKIAQFFILFSWIYLFLELAKAFLNLELSSLWAVVIHITPWYQPLYFVSSR